jgi:hypothetical protein
LKLSTSFIQLPSHVWRCFTREELSSHVNEVGQALITLFLGEAFLRRRLGASFNGYSEFLGYPKIMIGSHGVAGVRGDGASRLSFGSVTP